MFNFLRADVSGKKIKEDLKRRDKIKKEVLRYTEWLLEEYIDARFYDGMIYDAVRKALDESVAKAVSALVERAIVQRIKVTVKNPGVEKRIRLTGSELSPQKKGKSKGRNK